MPCMARLDIGVYLRSGIPHVESGTFRRNFFNFSNRTITQALISIHYLKTTQRPKYLLQMAYITNG